MARCHQTLHMYSSPTAGQLYPQLITRQGRWENLHQALHLISNRPQTQVESRLWLSII